LTTRAIRVPERRRRSVEEGDVRVRDLPDYSTRKMVTPDALVMDRDGQFWINLDAPVLDYSQEQERSHISVRMEKDEAQDERQLSFAYSCVALWPCVWEPEDKPSGDNWIRAKLAYGPQPGLEPPVGDFYEERPGDSDSTLMA